MRDVAVLFLSIVTVSLLSALPFANEAADMLENIVHSACFKKIVVFPSIPTPDHPPPPPPPPSTPVRCTLETSTGVP